MKDVFEPTPEIIEKVRRIFEGATEVIPSQHAFWAWRTDAPAYGWYCSNCGLYLNSVHDVIATDDEGPLFNYCPDCGKRMRRTLIDRSK